MRSFFDSTHPDDDDSPYGVLCHPRSDLHRKARAAVEGLFEENHKFVGDDLPANAKRQLQESFWELFLADALRRRGVDLVPRSDRKAKAGPDLLTASGIWIEAVAPGTGHGADRVPDWESGVARSVPDDQMQLRYLAALDEKRKKFDKYKQSSLVGATDPCVIAVNSANMGISGELDVHRGVRALFGLGWQVAHIDVASRIVLSDTWEHEDHIRKQSATPISKTGFLDATFAGVAAALFSRATPWAVADHGLFCDFVVAHNHNATTRMPLRALPSFQEYAVEEGALRRFERSE
jgi:hypothetical protein